MKTQVLPITPESVALAAKLLQQGELVALPTETVYGIAADARNGEAVKKIFEAKGRPQDNPLIVHICGMEMLQGIVSEVPERAKKLAAAFWPGPLTMVMPRGEEVSAVTCAGLDTVGVRMPSHPVVQQVIRESGVAFRQAQPHERPRHTGRYGRPPAADTGRRRMHCRRGVHRCGRDRGASDAAAPRLCHQGADGGCPRRGGPRQPGHP